MREYVDDSSFQVVRANGSGSGAKLVIRVRKHGASSKQSRPDSLKTGENGKSEEKPKTKFGIQNDKGKVIQNSPFSSPPPPPPRYKTHARALGDTPNKLKSNNTLNKPKRGQPKAKIGAKERRGIFRSIIKAIKRSRKKRKENKIDTRRAQLAKTDVQNKIDLFERNGAANSTSAKRIAVDTGLMTATGNAESQNRTKDMYPPNSAGNQKDQVHDNRLERIASTHRPPPPPPPRRLIAGSPKIAGGAKTFSQDMMLTSQNRNIDSKSEKIKSKDINNADHVSKTWPQWERIGNMKQDIKGTKSKTSYQAEAKKARPKKKVTAAIQQGKVTKCSLTTSVLNDLKSPTKFNLNSTPKNNAKLNQTKSNGTCTPKKKVNKKESSTWTTIYNKMRPVDHAGRKDIKQKPPKETVPTKKADKNYEVTQSTRALSQFAYHNSSTSLQSKKKTPDGSGRKTIVEETYHREINTQITKPVEKCPNVGLPCKFDRTDASKGKHIMQEEATSSLYPMLSGNEDDKTNLNSMPKSTLKPFILADTSSPCQMFSRSSENEKDINNKEEKKTIASSPLSSRKRRGSSFAKTLSVGVKKLIKAPNNAKPIDNKATFLNAIKGGGHKLRKTGSDNGVGHTQLSGGTKVEKHESKSGKHFKRP